MEEWSEYVSGTLERFHTRIIRSRHYSLTVNQEFSTAYDTSDPSPVSNRKLTVRILRHSPVDLAPYQSVGLVVGSKIIFTTFQGEIPVSLSWAKIYLFPSNKVLPYFLT